MAATRPATAGDLEAIRGIYNDAILNTVATFDTVAKTADDMRIWFGNHAPHYPVLVAEEAGRVVGWASLSRWSDRPAYDGTAELSVYVAGPFRGRRIGLALMEALVKAGRERGFHTVVSRIVQGSEVSIRLHERLGFSHVGVLREAGRKFGRLLDVTIMQLIL